MTKPLYIFSGTLSLCLGIAGIFIPLLPSTPFFILSTGLYVRSSPTLYCKVTGNRFVQKYLRDKKGSYNPFTLTAAILIMWITIILASSMITDKIFLFSLLIIAGITGTFFKTRLIIRHYKNRHLTSIKPPSK
ncbi:MAG: YbaN family protein [Bacteroidales bacterium]|nr:YbaN family protein [Bacteroidales bacterium]